MSYAPGTFNMGAPFNTYQVPYNQQQNQSYPKNQQYHNNSFVLHLVAFQNDSTIALAIWNRLKVIDTNARPAIVVTTASNDELINLGQCRLCIKLGEKTFEYYFQILKNLKRDLILGLNFQRTFKNIARHHG